jgi:hypothetical protein
MPRTCTVCAHPGRQSIEEALFRNKISLRKVSKQYRITVSALSRHTKHAVSGPGKPSAHKGLGPVETRGVSGEAETATSAAQPEVGTSENKTREMAAQLVADDRLTDREIAKRCGIAPATLERWKLQPTFKARVQAIVEAYARRALKHGIARKERRVGVLNDLHNRMLQVIEERAASPDMAAIPGGATGVLCKTLKGIGKGKKFRVVEEYKVDTGTIAEIRDVQKQAAEELGQGVTRTETLDLNQLFERMSEAEIEAVINDGPVPEWFESAVQGKR